MSKWSYRISLFLAGLFLLYWLTIKATFSWLQYAPEDFFDKLQAFTGITASVEQIKVSQTWYKVDIEVSGLSVLSSGWRFEANRLETDIHIFAPWLPGVRVGKAFSLDQSLLTVTASDNTGSVPQIDFEEIKTQLAELPYREFWQTTKVTDFSVVYQQETPIYLTLKLLHLHFGLKWSFVGLANFAVADEVATDFQFKGDFSTDIWHLPETGEASVDVLSPLKLETLYQVAPPVLKEKLPTGEFVGDIRLNLERGQLDYFRVYSRVQGLSWHQNDQLLPKSMAFALNVEQERSTKNLLKNRWLIEVEKVRFDNDFIEEISPVHLVVDTDWQLGFSTEKIDVSSVKPLLNVLLSELGYNSLADSVSAIQLENLSGNLDLNTAVFSSLTFRLPIVEVRQNDPLPGIKVEDVLFEKQGETIQVSIQKPVIFNYHLIKKEAIAFSFNQPIQARYNRLTSLLEVEKIKFMMDEVPLSFTAKTMQNGGVDMLLTAQPKDIDVVKKYLPYELMGKPLQKWLKTALIAGDNIDAQLQVKGKLSEFPFRNGEGVFKANAVVKNAELKFQPDWPAAKNFTAYLEFVPYHLKVSSPQVQMQEVTAKNVRVKLNNLHTKNIAVEVSGQAFGEANQAIALLNETPLTKKLELDQFLNKRVRASGPIEVDLKKIWVPVYGFDDKDEVVSGEAQLLGVKAQLFEYFLFEDVRGKVAFTESSVAAKQPVNFVFEDGPAELAIKTENGTIQLTGKGEAKPNYSRIKGASDWQAKINIPITQSDNGVTIEANATLDQLHSDYPKPFNVLKGSNKHPVGLVSLRTKDGTTHFEGEVGELFKFNAVWPEALDKPSDFKAILGHELAFSQLPQDEGYALVGGADEVDVNGWLDFFEEMGFFDGKKTDSPIIWRQSFLKAEKATYSKQTFHQVRLDWNSIVKEDIRLLGFNLKGDEVSLVGTQNTDNEFDVVLDKLKWEVSEDKYSEQNQPSTCELKQSKFPTVNFVGKNIRIGERLIQQARFKMVDSAYTVVIRDIELKFGRVNGSLKGEYRYLKRQNLSDITAVLSTKNVEDLTDFIGVKKGFTGKKGEISAEVKWLGDLSCYSLPILDGRVKFKVEDGVITDADPGFARVLGLISFEALARRLQLDIKDITEKGLAYDSIKGNGHLTAGVFQLEKMELKAPAASALVKGDIDLKNAMLDLDADITPAIGTTLPAVAIISGIATPIIGISAYALLKAVPQINEDLVTYKFDITGSFDKPKVKDRGLSLEVIRQREDNTMSTEDLLDGGS